MAALLSGGQEAPRHSKKNNGRGLNYAASAHEHYIGAVEILQDRSITANPQPVADLKYRQSGARRVFVSDLGTGETTRATPEGARCAARRSPRPPAAPR